MYDAEGNNPGEGDTGALYGGNLRANFANNSRRIVPDEQLR